MLRETIRLIGAVASAFVGDKEYTNTPEENVDKYYSDTNQQNYNEALSSNSLDEIAVIEGHGSFDSTGNFVAGESDTNNNVTADYDISQLDNDYKQ